MALLPRIPITSSFNNKLNIIGHLQFVLSKSTQIDAIDAFTRNLIQNKRLKWQIFYTKLNKLESNPEYEVVQDSIKSNLNNSSSETIKKQSLIIKRLNSKSKINLSEIFQQNCNNRDDINIDIRRLDRSQLDVLVESVLHSNEKYLNYILNECIKWKLSPSSNILEYCLKELSLKGNTKCVDDILKICDNFKKNDECNFKKLLIFKCVSLWKSGKLENALDTLINVYTSYTHQSKEYEIIHWGLKEIIKDTFTTKSEAVLIRLVKICNLIYDRYNDIYVISWIWKQLVQ